MSTVLWVLQIVLALLFVAAGILKLTRPREELMKSLPWVEDFTAGTVRFIGAMEVLGAAGLVLPALTGIAVVLTPLAATGLALVMALAAAVHARRKEPSAIAINLALLAIAVVIAWGRFGPHSF